MVEDLRKIKQVGHDRACLIIDRRDELGGEMTIEDFNKMDIPDSVKEKVFKSGLVFSPSKTCGGGAGYGGTGFFIQSYETNVR